MRVSEASLTPSSWKRTYPESEYRWRNNKARTEKKRTLLFRPFPEIGDQAGHDIANQNPGDKDMPEGHMTEGDDLVIIFLNIHRPNDEQQGKTDKDTP